MIKVKYVNVFYQISHIFSCFLIISLYHLIILYFTIISAMNFGRNIYSIKIKNRTKWSSIFGSQFIGNLDLFWTKKVSSFNI